MTKEEAVTILEQALNAANLKGVYSLADVDAILAALNVVKSEE